MAAGPQERNFQEEGKLAREKAEEGVGCLPSYPPCFPTHPPQPRRLSVSGCGCCCWMKLLAVPLAEVKFPKGRNLI